MRLKSSKNKRAESPIDLYTSLTYSSTDDFEWDENKRLKNVKKHEIDFVDALYVFDDINCKHIKTIRNNEERYMAVGKVDRAIWAVVYVFRHNKKRIISARCANTKERKDYEFIT